MSHIGTANIRSISKVNRVGVNQIETSIASNQLQLFFEELREPNVIAVKKSHKFPSCNAQPRVSCGTSPTVWLAYVNNRVSIFRNFPFEVGRVGRAIINYDHLEISES